MLIFFCVMKNMKVGNVQRVHVRTGNNSQEAHQSRLQFSMERVLVRETEKEREGCRQQYNTCTLKLH